MKGFLLLIALLLLQAIIYSDAADEYGGSYDDNVNAAGKCEIDIRKLLYWLPHRYECNKFFVCFLGQLLSYNCPPGLHFNVKSGYCEDPSSAGCKNGYENENCEEYVPPDYYKDYVVYP